MKLRYVNGTAMRENQNNHFDEYFTKPQIASYLFEKSKEIICKYENLDRFCWLEPSVGDGCFYKLMPKNKIGIDINKTPFDSLQMNFLDYELPKKPLIVMGNPPFGHRGVLALEFINHALGAEILSALSCLCFFKVWARVLYATALRAFIYSMRRACLKTPFI